MMKVSLEDQELLAEFFFGDEWRFAKHQIGKRWGKRRRSLRQQAVVQAICEPLLRSGAKCGNCSSYSKGECEAHSDFYGRALTKPDDICPDWTSRRSPSPSP